MSEHQAARDCIRAIDAALPEVADPDPDRSGPARAVIAENLKLYAYLLPLHIGKEDTVLFPLTEEVLSVREQEMLGEEFTRLSAVPGGPRRPSATTTSRTSCPRRRSTAEGPA